MMPDDNFNGVPPYFPFYWRRWRNSKSVRSMTMTQQGIYLNIIIHQWVNGSFPRNPWELSKLIGADYKTTVKWLEKYRDLAVCVQCGASWSTAGCQCGASADTATCHNTTLENINNDVISGIAFRRQDKTKRENTKQNITITSGVEDEAPETTSSPEPETPEAPLENVSDLLISVGNLLGKTKVKRSTLSKWEAALSPKVSLHSEAYVLGLLKYAVTENEVWARAITTVKKMDPIEYFAEKFETIETTREGDERFKKIRGRKSGKDQKIVEIEEKRKPMEL